LFCADGRCGEGGVREAVCEAVRDEAINEGPVAMYGYTGARFKRAMRAGEA
jgi:hypothetical protein